VIIEVVKRAEDTLENEIVLRVWESFGGRGRATLTSHFSINRVSKVNLLEEEEAESNNTNNIQMEGSHKVAFNYSPFEIITLKLTISPETK
jgi:alpha-mannosidase